MKILIYHPDYADKYRQILHGRAGDVNLLVARTPEEAGEMIGEADILFTKFTFPTDLLARASNLKWIQTMGAGVEAFTMGGHVPKGVILTRVTGNFGQRIAEYVAAYLLFITQDTRRVVLGQMERQWDFFCPDLLAGKVVGVAGLGSIGRRVAKKLSALDLTVIGLDNQPAEDPCLAAQFRGEELHDFLARLDFLVLCLPLTRNTRRLIGRAEFQAMKRSAYVLNVARGSIIDEAALIEAVKAGEISGAVLDVFDEEPLSRNSQLWSLPGVTITPHLSGPSTPEDMSEAFLENLELYRSGKSLVNQVNLERGF